MAKAYTAQEMRNCADNCDWRINPCVAAMLRQAAEMRERAENRINELGKCNASEEKNGGSCPALRDEEVTLGNCLDESCPNGAIIAELKDLLHCNAKEVCDGEQ